jgi:NAD(P)-dependent dehydrogenase (short-subunit alcohol dehydrogenase family)
MTQTIVITGGTAGVGRATVRRFARDRAAIAILARGQDGLDATAREIESYGGIALPIAIDVARADEVQAATERIERELGPIDVWINNAMTTVFGPIEAISSEEFERVTDVCYHGYVWGTRAALAVMRPRGSGTIIQVGSALAYRAIPLQAAYCGAKHAIRGFTDALRSELLHDKVDIHLCMVQLPAINTPQFSWCTNRMACEPQPVPPIFDPEIAAEAIYFAARHRRREIFLAWPTVKAVVGNKIAPAYADRVLAGVGYEGQCKPGSRAGDGPSNLFAPVPGDHGAHGGFGERARKRDAIATVTTWLGSAGVQLVIGAVIATAFGILSSILSSRRVDPRMRPT